MNVAIFRILRALDGVTAARPRSPPPFLEAAARTWTDWMRRLARALVVEHVSPPAAQRLARAGVLVPALGLWLVPMLAYARRYGALEVAGEASSGHIIPCRLPDLVPTYVCLFGRWEPDITAFVVGRLREGDVFVDVGANVGTLSLDAAERVGRSGRVVAFEPSARIFETLSRAVTDSGMRDVVDVRRQALSASPGRVAIYSGPDHNRSLTTTAPRPGLVEEGEVEATSLDEVLTGELLARVRVVKIDVEGAEIGVLAGMTRILGEAPSDLEIVVELSPGWWPAGSGSPEQVLRPFVEAGFCVYQIENEYFPWRYMWPRAVKRPRRLRGRLDPGVDRVDLVLSRVDAEGL